MSSTGNPERLESLSTVALLDRAGSGSREARSVLRARYLPRLKRWARAHLPDGPQPLVDSDALVENVLVETLERPSPRPADASAFLGDVIRAVRYRLDSELDLQRGSPLERRVGRESVQKYERALSRLEPSDRLAVVARIEHGMSYEEIAAELGNPSAEAAREIVVRALARLAIAMGELGRGSA